ncbi:unnamed protein product [Adineta ricciae]|uniref:Uncharacterized protein n=1 Tax=Adineta ricciae TaxID=249248 RepID=A0A814SIR2_ADIRI|nr:unnamed protein product [Adineta ricciae]CAF1282302.1 unnamed protein product [Adineta ricciae]
MTRNIATDDMATIRRSLADAGIYFDKLYINQAYFNSNFTIQTTRNKTEKPKTGFWNKLLCGTDAKRSSTGTQTILTVRDDSELIPPSVVRRQKVSPTDNVYDRRRCRPVNREHSHSNYQQSVRRRRTSLTTRSTQVQRPKPINDASDDENNEFSV